MNQVHYIISDAAKELHVESHVLRYWEEELHLQIPRNKMGHRIYGEKEMLLLKQIMLWKEEGLSLRDIQKKCIQSGMTTISESGGRPADETGSPSPRGNGQVIPYPKKQAVLANAQTAVEKEDHEDEKMANFKQLLGRIVTDAIRENSSDLSREIATQVSDHVNKELDFLFREKEENDEMHFRSLDETLRSIQKARQEAAAAEISEIKTKRKHHFGRKKERH